MIKLHLGCGNMILDGYINCDLYTNAQVICDIKQLPYEDNSIDEIYNCHVIEHLDFFEGQNAIREWHRVLIPNGKLIIETPDLIETCKALLVSDCKYMLYSQLFGDPWIPGQVHKFLYSEEQLVWTLKNNGFTNMTRNIAGRYIGNESINLRIDCNKIGDK